MKSTGDVHTKRGKASAENKLVCGMVSKINFKSKFLGKFMTSVSNNIFRSRNRAWGRGDV